VRGVSEFTAEAVGALGQDPVGGGEGFWVEADVNALGDGGGQIGAGAAPSGVSWVVAGKLPVFFLAVLPGDDRAWTGARPPAWAQ
jgi:hypothetical protein